MEIFDPAEISVTFIRDQYERLVRRGTSTGETVHRAYGKNRKPIKTVYVKDPAFNAYATKNDEHYYAQISSGVPILILILFHKIFENPVFMPELPVGGKAATDVSLPFIADPARIDLREEWRIKLNEPRATAADFFAEICMTFIVNHEIGHVLSGHVEGVRHYDGEGAYAEMTSQRQSAAEIRNRRRAWEVDADFIASTLLTNYLQGVDTYSRQKEPAGQVFFRGDDTVIHILSCAIVALLAFFSYMRGVRYRQRLNSDHPHPLVRALYTKDALIRAARQHWQFDEEKLFIILDDRLDEMLTTLEALGLSDNWRYTDEYSEQIRFGYKDAMRLQAEFRTSCESWSWINWFDSAD